MYSYGLITRWLKVFVLIIHHNCNIVAQFPLMTTCPCSWANCKHSL